MTDSPHDRNDDDALRSALKQVPFAREVVARELRMMAAAEPPYRRFTYMPPSVKSVWLAAADLLDPQSSP